MDSRRIARASIGIVAGAVAWLALRGLIYVADRWADVAPSDATVALYLVFGSQQGYGQAVVWAGGLAAACVSVWVALQAASLRQALARSAVLGLLVAVCMAVGAASGWLLSTPDWRGQVTAMRLWLGDTTPPVVALTVPEKPVRGPAEIRVATADESEHTIITMTVDGWPISPAAHVLVETANLPDGEHTVVVVAEDHSRQRNRATATATFRSETQWWMRDVTPPVIALTVPTRTVTGVVTISLATSDEGEHYVTQFMLDGVALPITHQVSIDTAQLADGEHVILVAAEDVSRRRNRSQVQAVLRSDNHPPVLSLRFDPAQATQGAAQVIHISVNEPLNGITATLAGRPLVLARSTAGYWGIVGFGPEMEPVTSQLAVQAVDMVGHTSVATATHTLVRYDFPLEVVGGERLQLAPDVASLLDYAASENAYMQQVFSVISPEKLWDGLFMVPVQGRQTSAFAVRRSYRGEPPSSPHGGVDIAADAGTPVPAPNRGKVVLAEPLKICGNAVIIDHGLGVYTRFCHLSEIRVRKGQPVEKGQIVGLVGNTGLSTGPHLHWEMRVTGNVVNPWVWTQRTFP